MASSPRKCVSVRLKKRKVGGNKERRKPKITENFAKKIKKLAIFDFSVKLKHASNDDTKLMNQHLHIARPFVLAASGSDAFQSH
jgi:hypothetical protein